MPRTKFTPEQTEQHSKAMSGKGKSHPWGFKSSRRTSAKSIAEFEKMKEAQND